MNFTCKPDYEEAQNRIDAFWAHAEADRPIVSMSYPKQRGLSLPPKTYASWEEQWLDFEYRIEAIDLQMQNTVYAAEAMPVIFPNLGPEIFSAWAGCPYAFGKTTTWSKPCIHDWEADSDRAVVDMKHPLFEKIETFTRLLLEQGKGKYIVGLTDFHPGGDHLAALRDPENLAFDLLENPEFVKAKLSSSYDEYFKVFDYFVDLLKSNDQPIATWTPLTARDCMYVPSNDFSCMISQDMFREFFLDGIIRECKHYKNSIYHLDGPNALRHLDDLLDIPELNAIQWVPGAGHEAISEWMPVYKKVLSKNKSIQILEVHPSDLPLLMELPSKGVWLCMSGIQNEDMAKDVMNTIQKWPKSK